MSGNGLKHPYARGLAPVSPPPYGWRANDTLTLVGVIPLARAASATQSIFRIEPGHPHAARRRRKSARIEVLCRTLVPRHWDLHAPVELRGVDPTLKMMSSSGVPDLKVGGVGVGG